MDNAFGQQELIADNRDEINNWRIALGPVMGERWASLPEQSPGIASAVPTTALAPLEVSNQPIHSTMIIHFRPFCSTLCFWTTFNPCVRLSFLDAIIQKDGLV